MKLFSPMQREGAQKFWMRWLSLPAAIVFVAMFCFASEEIAILGQGPHGLLPAVFVGYCSFIWIRSVAQKHSGRNYPAFFTRPAQIIGIAFVALPFCVITGRLVFSFVPLIWSDTVGAFIGFFIALQVPEIFMADMSDQKTQVERGTSLVDEEETDARDAQPAVRGTVRQEDGTFRWAGRVHAEEVAFGNLLVVGARGTGKTLMHREHMRSELPRIKPGSGRLGIIYDVKCEVVSELTSMNLSCDCVIMNPFDMRCSAWDLAADISSPADAKQFAESLFPEPIHAESKHWTSSSRDIVIGILSAFNRKRPGEWDLGDLIHVSTFQDRMGPLLAGTDLVSYFEPPPTFANTLNTIRTVMGELEPVAGLWRHVPREKHLSLKQFVTKKDSILILGGHEHLQASLSPINRVMVRQLTEAFSAGPESPTVSRLFFYCDELKHAGRLDALPKLINTRSKGGRLILGFQDLEGLYTVYGKDVAKEILAGFHSVSVLKLTSTETAKWASDLIGEAIVIEDLADPRPSGGDEKLHRQRVKREAVLPSELQNLRTFKDGRVEGVHRFMGNDDAIRQTVRYPFNEKDPKVDFQRRPKEQEELPPWSEEDARRFNIPIDSKNKPSKRRRRKPKDPPSNLDSFGRFEF